MQGLFHGTNGASMQPMVDDADAVASPTTDVPADAASTEVATGAESASEPVVQSASERMPKDAEGNLLYEQADAELAWDALVEQSGGDESVAQSVADGMVADMEAALKKLEKTKPQGGASVSEKIAAAQKHKAEIDAAQAQVDAWKAIAGVSAQRRAAAEAQAAAEEEVEDAADAQGNEENANDLQNNQEIEDGSSVGVDGRDVVGADEIEESDVLGSDSQKELDENGRPFVIASNGTTTFGVITEETGLPAAPIKLSEGFQNEDGKGYGLLHIEANHGKQIRNAGFGSVEEFVSFVATNYDENNIRVGKRRDKSGSITYLIQVTDEHDNTLFIELSRDGSYWNVNSGGIFRKGYADKKRTVVKTEPQQPNNAVSTGSSLSESGDNGITLTEPNGEPTVPSSDSKVTGNSSSEQEKGGENADGGVNISPIEGYTYDEVIEYVSNDIQDVLSEAGIDGIEIVEVWPHGSRMRGDAKEDSDLDVVLFYKGDYKEDALFNAIGEVGIEIGGVKVDVNPIQVTSDNTIDVYKQHSAEYDAGKNVPTVETETLENGDVRITNKNSRGEVSNISIERDGKIVSVDSYQDGALFEHTEYDADGRATMVTRYGKDGEVVGVQRYEGGRLVLQEAADVEGSDGVAADKTINGAVDMGTMRPVMTDSEFDALLKNGSREEVNAYLGEIEDALRVGEGAPLDGANAVRADYRAAVEQYGKDNIPSDVMRGLEARMKPYDDLKRALFDRKYALEDRLRALDAQAELEQEAQEKAEKAAQKQTAFGGFLAGKTALAAANAEKALNKKYKFDGEVMSVAEFVERHANDGTLALSTSEVNKYKGASRSAWNRMSAAEQKADEERVKNGGTKTVYMVNGYDLGKTAYEYGQYLQGQSTENREQSTTERIAQAEGETDVAPTDGQKEAGNYKKGHVRVAGYDISIEQPKGSVRSGVDANGNKWEQVMHNTYGYIRGTEGVDGDHIDVFLANDMDAWNGEQVFVVDQYNEDGSFDEHKVMLGFNSIEEAQSAYLSNYEDGWADKHRIVVTGTNAADFKKWVDSSHRKTKAFADYKNVKKNEGQSGTDNSGRDGVAADGAKNSAADYNIADEALMAERGSEAFARATEHTIDALKAAGVEVVEATDAMVEEVLGLAEMHKQKKAPETASVLEEHQPTVVSSADGAKLLKDLDSAITEYENKSGQSKTFLGDIAQVLGATKHGSNSQYATFEAVNGKVFTIRLANHNAKVSNFDNHGENEGISIVVTAQDNNGINNDGNAHVVEFFYDAIKLRKADGKPLVEILKSIKQALYSGEYKDTTGLAQAEEVNIEFLRTADGVVYGWAVGGKVYLTKEGMNPNTPAHEYTHLWAQMVEQNDPTLWGRIVDGLRGCATWNDVLSDKAYEGIWGDDSRMASEVLSRLTGAENYRREMARAQAEIADAKGVFDKAEKVSVWENVKQALRLFLDKVKSLILKGETIRSVESDVPAWMEFVDMALGDLYGGVNPGNLGGSAELMFIGERGAAAMDKAEEASVRLDNLAVARDMEAQGKDALAIKMATGWERGADGQWRYEVMDVKDFDIRGNIDFGKRHPEVLKEYERFRKLRAKKTLYAMQGLELSEAEQSELDSLSPLWLGTQLHNSRKLKDYVDAPELFAAYPELRDIQVRFENLELGSLGYYRPSEGKIGIKSTLDKETMMSVLNHEIQHAIQHIEGFARGGNIRRVKSKVDVFKEEARVLYDKMLETSEWAEKMRLQRRWFDETNESELAKIESRIEEIDNSGVLREIETMQSELSKKYGLDANVGKILSEPHADNAEIWEQLPESFYDKYDVYSRLAGEVEARNTQARMGKSLEERRASLASETADVAQEDQIFIYEGLESASSEGRPLYAPISPIEMSAEEKAKRGEMLRTAPAIDVSSNVITRTGEVSARKAAEMWWDNNVKGSQLYSTEIGEVEINKNSVESSLAHRYSQKKLDAITSLVDGFNNAVYLGTLPDGNRQEGVQNHYFAYPINYGGERNYVFCRAMQDANKNRLYVHEVFVADKIKEGDTLQTAASQPHGGISLYRDILANVLSYGKGTNSSDTEQNNGQENDGDTLFSYKPFGGNSGYVGYSMSKRAAQARAEGRFPKTDFKKEYGVTERVLDALVKAGVVDNAEWHHTSSYGNRTPFYGWVDDAYADVYADNKKAVKQIIEGKDADGSSFATLPAENPYTEMAVRIPEGWYPFVNSLDDSLTEEERDAALMERFGDAYTQMKEASENNRLYHEFEANKGRAERAFYAKVGERLKTFFEEKAATASQLTRLDGETETGLRGESEELKDESGADIVQRMGDGALSDDAVSDANDLIGKVLGKRRYGAKQRAEFAERQRRNMAKAVERMAKQLHLDNVEVVTDVSTLEGKKAKAKGFYSKRTGKITIVVPNNSGIYDAEITLLHEAVAHYGLRKLFGKHFDAFLDNVYQNASLEVRQKIASLAAKNGWDFRTATEDLTKKNSFYFPFVIEKQSINEYPLF